MLERAGHEATVAENGREVLALLEREAFDVVLMDVQMPEMDGLEATAAIRERERATGGHLPIVALTAHAMKGDAERCLAAGMDAYLAKPLQPRELAAAIEGVLGGAPRPPQPRAPAPRRPPSSTSSGSSSASAATARPWSSSSGSSARTRRSRWRASGRRSRRATLPLSGPPPTP